MKPSQDDEILGMRTWAIRTQYIYTYVGMHTHTVVDLGYQEYEWFFPLFYSSVCSKYSCTIMISNM